MIVVDTQNKVQGSAPIIERVDSGGESNLIKVNIFPEREYGYYFIGTIDRDLYKIYTDTSVPDPEKEWEFYVLENGEYNYVDVTPKPDEV